VLHTRGRRKRNESGYSTARYDTHAERMASRLHNDHNDHTKHRATTAPETHRTTTIAQKQHSKPHFWTARRGAGRMWELGIRPHKGGGVDRSKSTPEESSREWKKERASKRKDSHPQWRTLAGRGMVKCTSRPHPLQVPERETARGLAERFSDLSERRLSPAKESRHGSVRENYELRAHTRATTTPHLTRAMSWDLQPDAQKRNSK
jgi:hypothetical protein